MGSHVVFALAMVGVFGLACQWVAWRVRLPAILFLLVMGIMLGPITGVLNPDELFGELLFPLVSLAVAVILFEGSLTLKFDDIRETQDVVFRLVTVGVVVSWAVITLFTWQVIGLSWQYATLFGALVVVTGPTVIVPMLRTIRPNRQITNILRWEGILIDPIGALLAVLVYDFIVASNTGGNEWLTVLAVFSKILLVGFSIGFIAGYSVGTLLRSPSMPKFLHNVFVLISVFAAFAIANELQEESGLLAVTLMGVWLANMRDVPVDRILNFKESLSLLLISGLFIVLGARLQLSELVTLGWPALLVLLLIQFVAQPLKVFASAIGSNLTWQEKLMISWIGPRGIIAAAVSALFALQLQNMGYENTSILVTLTFAVIIGTVVIQSLTAKRLAKILGVTDNGVRGILIVGANPVGRAIGKVLQENDFEVMLIDSHWPYLSEARMQGLQIFHGNPVSQLVDQKLDFVGYGSCFALSQNDELNVLAAQRYIPEFGSKQVYSLRKAASKKNPEKYAASEEMRGRLLFEEGVSYAKLASLIAQGAEVKSTVIREEFSIDDYLAMYSERAVPLLLLKASGKLVVVTEALTELIAPPGTTVISLVQPAKETKDTDDPKVEGKVAKDAKEDNASPDN